MSRIVSLWMITAALVAIMFMPAQAQYAPFISLDLCAAMSTEGAPEACATFAQCVADQIDTLGACEQEFYQSMLRNCAQPKCDHDMLFSLSILSIAASHAVERSEAETEVFQNTLEMVLLSYVEPDTNETTTLLTRLYDEYPHRLLPYAAGLAYENAGDFDQALAAYGKSIETQFFTSLAFYSRGYLRAELGDTVRADQDFYTFSELRTGTPYFDLDLDLTTLIVPQVETDDLLSDAETWMLYPVAWYGEGPGGVSASYLFDAPARSIEIKWFEGTNTLAIVDFDPSIFDIAVPQVLFFDCDGDRCARSLALQETFLGLTEGGTFLTLSFDGDYAEVEQRVSGSESGTWSYWVMLPPDAEDPRPEIPCENGTYPLLQQGDEVVANPFWMPLTVYAAPDATSEIVVEVTSDSPATVQISGELTCGEGGNWWPVTVDGNTSGWATDADNGYYSLVTADWQPRRPVAELLSLP